MEYKIIQIIPAPKNMYSVYQDLTEEIKCKIICLALVEYKDGGREVVPMDITDDGVISILSDGLKYVC